MKVRIKPGEHPDDWLADLHCSFGGGGSPSGNTTTVQKSDPWEGQQPYLKQQMGEAQRLYGGGIGSTTPQYDMNAYNAAQTAYNSSGSPGGMVWSAKQQRMVPGPSTGPTGTAPKLSDFALPGGGTTTTSSQLAPEYYPGQTIADQSPETLLAQNLTTDRALSGSPLMNSAQGLLTDTMQGDYLNSNPYLDQNVNKALDTVQQRVNSAFGQGGRFGSGINQGVLAKEMGDTASQMYGQNFDQERSRQMQGMLFAPQMANQDYFDIGQLANVGMQKEGRSQGLINEDVNKYNYNANLPANALRNYIGLTGGNFGGTQTSSSPYYQNQGASALGGALGGASLGGSLGGMLGMTNPYGALLGGGLGLLGGLFG